MVDPLVPPTSSDDLRLSALPVSLEVLAVPCGARTPDVGIRNAAAERV
ncbi:hypothetical protein ABN028_10900 [Actinopolymorpha sp. B17G11]